MSVTVRCLAVLRRDLVVARKTWRVGFLPPLLEPLLFVLAFGVGLSGLVGAVGHRGVRTDYLRFVAPALLAAGAMNAAFFENTYASFVRMFYQKTFDAMLATPLTIEDVVTGEILWGATRAALSAGVMMLALAPFGLLAYPGALLILPLALLGGFAFGAAGMCCTGLLPTIDTFNLPVFLFVTPMFLLGGSFFPLSQLPGWAQHAALALPFTHLVLLDRDAALGTLCAASWASLSYLALFGLACYLVALRAMRRRLIV